MKFCKKKYFYGTLKKDDRNNSDTHPNYDIQTLVKDC